MQAKVQRHISYRRFSLLLLGLVIAYTLLFYFKEVRVY